ncbi:MAG: hypothetical protein Q8P01_05400, partial [bacterium]|nr:hypothetical protein [bacterium]
RSQTSACHHVSSLLTRFCHPALRVPGKIATRFAHGAGTLRHSSLRKIIPPWGSCFSTFGDV